MIFIPTLILKEQKLDSIKKMAYNYDDAILVNTKNFDINRVKYEPPTEKKIKGSDADYTSCSISYENDEGTEAPFLYAAKPQQCFGLQNAMTLSGDKKENEYSICYYARDYNNEQPDKQEQAFIEMCHELEEKLCDHLIENMEYFTENQQVLIEKRKFVKTTLKFPLKKDDKGKAIKNKKGGKVYDEEKPQRIYVAVPSDKKSGKLYAKFYGPGDEELTFAQIYEVRGIIEPVFRFAHVYISDSGANIKIKLHEANFTPSEGFAPPKRFIGANKNKTPVSSKNEEEPSKKYDPNDELDDEPAPPKKVLKKKISPKEESPKEEKKKVKKIVKKQK